MFDTALAPGLAKPDLYAELAGQVAGVTAGEPDRIANLANCAAILFHGLPDLNWAGFYLVDETGAGLVLGPFQGKAACIRIPFGKGVCGTAAATRAVQCVEDVENFPGHIACDSASRSELVVPIEKDGVLIGVLDLDSPIRARFDAEDVAGAKMLAQTLVRAL